MEEKIYKNYSEWKDWNNDSFGKTDRNSLMSYEKNFHNILKKNNGSVLEIGFGNGAFLKWLRDNNYNPVGVEILENKIKIARENNFEVYNSIFSISNKKFSTIFAFDVLEHIPVENSIDFIKKIYNLLEDDGLFIARFPNGDNPFSLPLQNGDFSHVNFIGINKAKHLAQIAGFKKVERMKLVSENIFSDGLKSFLRFVFRYTFIKPISFFIRYVYFFDKKHNLDFESSNLTVIFYK